MRMEKEIQDLNLKIQVSGINERLKKLDLIKQKLYELGELIEDFNSVTLNMAITSGFEKEVSDEL